MKRLFLIRGLPGSGKTTLAKLLCPEYQVAAHDFMVDGNGDYRFSPKRLRDTHESCLARAGGWMHEGHRAVAVHNTFVTEKETRPYFRLAKLYGYEVFIISCENVFGSVHGVPESTMSNMHAKWDRSVRRDMRER